jgi:aldehyde:ferredoxin oxidoreductase
MAHTTRNRLLRVDLSTETVESDRVPDRWLREYIGGKGLGARYLYEELQPNTDPLGPENILLFMLGPLSGYLPGEQRYAAVTKSPLSGAFLDSYSGGRFPAVLAQALGDHIGILVTGVANRPTRLEIENGSGTITPAENWGADAVETCEAFPDAAVACIGPAGENRVSYATIASDAGDHHAGRGGAGAVIGSKRLKAVVAYGESPHGLDALRERYEEEYVTDDTGRWQSASETLESIDFADRVGALSARGWQQGRFEGTDEIGIEAARETAIEREHEDESIPGGFRVETPEGEIVPRGAAQMTLGAGLGIAEFDAVAVLGETCDRLAVDVISAGNAIAWAMRASRRGVIDREITFGDEGTARALIEEIVTRESVLGDALANGVETASDRFDSGQMIPTVKGMELPNYDPRGAQSMALAYATSDRGACHRRARPVETEVFADEPWDAETAAQTVIETQNSRSVLWSLVVDDFVGAVFTDLGAEWFSAVGLDYSPEELRQTGERIWTLTRLFNLREGFSRADDALPAALCKSLIDEPESAIDPMTFNEMLDAYYAQRGWNRNGCPTCETLSRLDLTGVVSTDRIDAEEPITTMEEEP